MDHMFIPLTHGKFAKVSRHRFEELNRFKWQAWNRPGMSNFYAVRQYWTGEKLRGVYMHRQILGLGYGDKRQGDHINRDTLDNTDCNLRIASRSENARNQGTRASSGLKGAYHHRDGKWMSTIMVHRKRIYLGVCATKEEAHRLYCEASKIYHGEFGRTK